MSEYHLAQINVGRFLYDRADPANADFMNALDPVNAQADTAPGFVWRLVGDGNDATDLVPDESDPQLLVNMSVWTDVEALAAFVYRNSDHLAFMRRRREWFEKIEIFQALWWVPAGHIPSVAEGMKRVAMLRANGPNPDAFTFRQTFAAPDGTPAIPQLDECA
jgi:heme-degrading monooxygenase HmoA